MGSFHTLLLCSIVLVLQSWLARSDFNLAPMFSPIFGDLCKRVECGKGNCKESNKSIGYVCECEPGWKQTRPQHDDDFKFLPCVIPNCSLDLSCSEAAPPAAVKDKRTNDSFFDPCNWADCGGGTCNKTSLFTHKCECNEGYYNLLNVTAFPCFKECALGMDCADLGLNIMNKSSSAPNSSENITNSQATSITINDINWKIILISSSLAFLLWK